MATVKGGPLLGMYASSLTRGTYLVDAFVFTRPVTHDDTVAVFATFPDGGLHVDSLRFNAGFDMFPRALVQQEGDLPPVSASGTEPEVVVVLPDDLGHWEAALDSGSAQSPRGEARQLEIAFAPLRELDDMFPGNCTAGGLDPDPATGRRYRHAVQPVALGGVDESATASLVRRPVADYRLDLHADGVLDAVDLDGPGGANGPEVVSPQVAGGEWGSA